MKLRRKCLILCKKHLKSNEVFHDVTNFSSQAHRNKKEVKPRKSKPKENVTKRKFKEANLDDVVLSTDEDTRITLQYLQNARKNKRRAIEP